MTIERTPDGMVVLYHRKSGKRYARYPVDAKDMLRSGDYVTSLADVGQGSVVEAGDTGSGQGTQDPPAQDAAAELNQPLAPENDPARVNPIAHMKHPLSGDGHEFPLNTGNAGLE
jgi:hypothetical protein